MAGNPTIAGEDAKRPNRERECLVGERTRVVNRIKATAGSLAALHTPEGMPLPPNVLAEL
jgi:transposase